MKLSQRNSAITEQQRYSQFLHPKYWSTWLMLAGLWLLTRLPFSMQMWIGRMLGRLSYWLVKSRRHICEVNIRLCFPEKTSQEQQQLVKQTFISYGQGMMETAMSWFRNNKGFADRVTFVGQEHMQQALDSGHGVLMIGGHFSTLDFGGALMGLEYEYDIVHRYLDNPLFNLFMNRTRSRYVNNAIARKDVRGMIKALRKGHILWYAPDQDYGRRDSVFVPFMGVSTATITGTSRLAQMGKAKVVPVVYTRNPDNRTYQIEFKPPLNIPSGDDVEDARLFNQWLEEQVRKYPDQYLWLHKRFKTRPEGEASVY